MKNIMQDWLTKKLSRPDIERLCKEESTDKNNQVLIVHCDDMPFDDYFPNRNKANTKPGVGVDIIANKDYSRIPVENESFDTIVCTGLLEHIKDPLLTLKEFHRVLRKNGKVIISASYVFSTHNAPENYFHFSIYGMEHLLKEADLTPQRVLPSSKPFRTMGILFQRICYQTDMFPPFKAIIFLIAKIMPVFDHFIQKDYGDIKRDTPIESSLYSNVQAVATKE